MMTIPERSLVERLRDESVKPLDYFTAVLLDEAADALAAAPDPLLVEAYRVRIAALEDALRAVLNGLPYLGLSSQENWECNHGFPLDECQNADCPEMLGQKAITAAAALLTEKVVKK